MTQNDYDVVNAEQYEIDACKKRLGANPKSFRQLVVEKNWKEVTRNYLKLHDALVNQCVFKTLVLDGAEL